MLTIITTPRLFNEHFGIIQRNAIKSWTLLRPQCELIFYGNEKGTDETAAELGILHIPEIKKNEFGTPFLDDVLNKASKIAKNKSLAFVSTDIILLSDFIRAIKNIKTDPFLMVGKRWNIDIKKEIQFNNPDWEEDLRSEITKQGEIYGPSAIDYFVFSSGLLKIFNFLPFLIGRPGTDGWLIYHARALRVPVIDATEAVTAIHQNHEYSHSAWSKKGKFGTRVKGPEFERNLKLAGGFLNRMTIRDADWILTSEGLRRPKFPRNIFSKLSLFYPWRVILAIKRKLIEFFS